MAGLIEAEFEFFVPGVPVPWARAGRDGRWGKVRSFTPRRQAEAMAEIAARALVARVAPFGPDYVAGVQLEILARFEIPRSWPKYRRAAALGAFHLQKPDGDNLGKMIKDALQGVVWRDDAQVADTRIVKTWAAAGETVVRICAL